MRGGAEAQALVIFHKLDPRVDIGVIFLREELKNNRQNSHVPRTTCLAMLHCCVMDHVQGPVWAVTVVQAVPVSPAALAFLTPSLRTLRRLLNPSAPSLA